MNYSRRQGAGSRTDGGPRDADTTRGDSCISILPKQSNTTPHLYLIAQFPYDGRALEAANEHAERAGARFLDARSTPWLICSCGEVLVFVEDAAAVVM